MTRRSNLIVYVPGLSGPQHSAELIRRLAAHAPQDWEVQTFDHGLAPLSTEPIDGFVRDLSASIDEWSGGLARAGGADSPLPNIVLVGHSLGGLLIRAAFVASGFDVDGRARPASWARAVSRLVLIGSPNGGFSVGAQSAPIRWLWRLATPWLDYSMESIESGAPWISNLRLQWIDAFRHPANQGRLPEIVQVIGTRDRMVRAEDISDSRYLAATRVYETPRTDHSGLVRLDDKRMGDERWARIQPAVFGRAADDVAPMSSESKQPMDDESFTFVVHGIRGSGNDGWVQRLAQTLGAERTRVYGYKFFSALQFSSGLVRRKQLRAFTDVYCGEYAKRDPDGFSFVAHSNGTYIVANAMQDVPRMRFRRAVLAGSVLPGDFAWRSLEGQIGSFDQTGAFRSGTVFNDRAAADFPVGFLCSLLNGLGNKDIGTGGFDGFTPTLPFVREKSAVFPGGHGAALPADQTRADQIRALVTEGRPDDDPSGSTNGTLARVSRAVGIRWVGLVLIALAVAVLVGVSIGLGAAAAAVTALIAAGAFSLALMWTVAACCFAVLILLVLLLVRIV